ncbi:MAG TPA: AsmA-like C-terminal region-containing protein, partial [Elusimicrobiales bacterium]|nr:AsmA-like C-terminal region-containing protein [Elusimicrobiales bacterium]
IMPKILPLFRGKVEMGRVKATGIDAYLIRYKDGSFNFSDFTDGAKTQQVIDRKTKKKKEGKKLDLVVAKLIVEDSSLKFTDYMLGATTKIDKFNLKAKNVSLKRSFQASVNFIANHQSAQLEAHTPLKASAIINLSAPTQDMAKITTMEIKDAKFVVKMKDAKGKANNFTVSNFNFKTTDASLNKPFELSSSFTAKYKLDGEVSTDITSKLIIEPKGLKWQKAKVKIMSLTTNTGSISADVKGNISNLKDPSADLHIVVLPFNTSELSKYMWNFAYKLPIPKITIDTKFNATDKMVNISSLKIKPEQSTLSGNVVLLKKKNQWTIFKGAVSFNVILSELAKSAANLKEYDMGGTLSGKLAINQSKGIMNYDGNINFDNIKTKYQKSSLSNVNGNIKMSKNQLSCKSLAGKLNGSDFKTSLYATMYPNKVKAKLNAFVDTVQLDLLLPDVNPADKQKTAAKKGSKSAYKNIKPLDLDLKIDVNKITHPNFNGNNASVYCNLTDVTPKLDKVSGTSSFAVKNGNIKDLSAIVKKHNMAKAFLLPVFALQKATNKIKLNFLPDFDNISYSVIEGNYKFNDGYMQIIKSQMLSSAADTSATGGANFKTDSLNMKISTKVKVGKGLPVNFTVTGKISDPKVKYDVLGAITKGADVGKVKKNVEEEAKKFLKSLF